MKGVGEKKRVVLLGASNLWLSQPWWIPHLLGGTHGPREIHAAYGHGRSYGLRSRIGFRQLDSILRCGLWQALNSRPEMPTEALIADVGNDIAYGVSTDQILAWVDECIDRLVAHGAKVTIVGLPTESLSRLSEATFTIFQRIFFPTRSIGRRDAISRALAVDAGLLELSRRYQTRHIANDLSWYRWDPIHICPSKRCQAWQLFLDHEEVPQPDLVERFAHLQLRPERWWSWGLERQALQPVLDRNSAGDLSLW